jgi:hypothetical protein
MELGPAIIVRMQMVLIYALVVTKVKVKAKVDKLGVLTSEGISPSSVEDVSAVIYSDSGENHLDNLGGSNAVW